MVSKMLDKKDDKKYGPSWFEEVVERRLGLWWEQLASSREAIPSLIGIDGWKEIAFVHIFFVIRGLAQSWR